VELKSKTVSLGSGECAKKKICKSGVCQHSAAQILRYHCILVICSSYHTLILYEKDTESFINKSVLEDSSLLQRYTVSTGN
jgi:hypothetical protein